MSKGNLIERAFYFGYGDKPYSKEEELSIPLEANLITIRLCLN